MRSIQQSYAARSRRYSIGSSAIVLGVLASSTAMALPLGAAVPQSAPAVAPNAIAQATTLVFVHPTVGNDSSGVGSQSAPFRTISHALRVAQPNTTILLSAGTYSSETGETFPIVMRSGVTIQGDPSTRGQGVIIRGGGVYASRTSANQNVAMLGANQAALSGVTVTNSNPRGYGLWIESTSPIVENNTFVGSNHDGISIVGNGAPIVRSNYFTRNGASGMTIFGTVQAEVRDNIFENTGYGINIADSAQPRLISNQIRQNRSGIVVQESARPILRGNTIEHNQQDGLVAIAQSQPDLGTDADPGNNIFRSNGHADVNTAAARLPISTAGNQLANSIGTETAPVASRPAIATPPLPARTAPAPTATAPAAPAAPPPARPVPAPAATSPSGSAFAGLPQLQASPTIPAAAPAPAAPPPQYSAVRPSAPNTVGWQVQTQSAPAPSPVAIPIPVTPASPAAVTPPRPIAPVDRSTPAPAPIREITVERQAAPAAPAARPAPSPAPVQQAVQPAPNANLLPVPSATIPMGNIGGLPTVNVSRNPLDRPASAPVAVGGGRALAMGLRYRVVVDVSSDRDQAALRAIVPGAFRVSINGRVLMQTGAYSDRANADDAAQQLSNQGFRASVQAIE